jgi:RNA polymerase sigma factor (sigma-70 family)
MAAQGVLQWLRMLASVGGQTRPDHELVSRFVEAGDQTAFTLLVQRHGPMVYGVCQRLLDQAQDAEDAFQATFLVFARKASSIRSQASVGCWLYGVASRVAVKLRRKNVRQRSHEKVLIDPPEVAAEEVSWSDVRAVLDEELAKLPERLRLPVVLCCLDGKTRDEAAQELGLNESTLRGRLERGRDQLRIRLTSRGVTLSAALLASLLTQNAASALPAPLLASTVTAALAIAAGKPLAGVVSVKVIGLVEGVLQMMWYSKVKMAMIALLAIALTGSGVGWVMHDALAGAGQELAQVQPKPKAEPPGDAKAENAALRAEVAKLRAELDAVVKELKSLKGAAPPEQEATYEGKPLSHYLRQFKDRAPVFRGNALGPLGAFAEQDKKLIPLLAAALKDEGVCDNPNVTVGDTAREVLRRLGPDVTPTLLGVFTDGSAPKAQVRAAQILSTSEFADKSMMPKLVKTLQDELAIPNQDRANWDLREAIIVAFGNIGTDAKPAAPLLAQLFEGSLKGIESRYKDEPLKFAELGTFARCTTWALLNMDPELSEIVPAKSWTIILEDNRDAKKQPSPMEIDAAWRQFRAALQKRFEKQK